jgi:hypothetical protein
MSFTEASGKPVSVGISIPSPGVSSEEAEQDGISEQLVAL